MSLLGATVLLLVVLTAAVFGLAALRSRFRYGTRRDTAETQRRMLAANWDAVERAARHSGMDTDEIAAVRRRVFGA
jgi:hypothetical protein